MLVTCSAYCPDTPSPRVASCFSVSTFSLRFGQECVQNTSEECTLSADRLFSLLDDASEKTFLIGMTDPKDQKVFTGDEKIGLEDKNLVSLLGFLLEQKLVCVCVFVVEVIEVSSKINPSVCGAKFQIGRTYFRGVILEKISFF